MDIDESRVTELEGVILGIVWSREPCSPYVILTRFQQSPTWGWSSSTGAIYPAIRRLKQRGLLDSRPEPGSKRNAALLSLTGSGRRALRDWISALSEEMGSASVDPIRTRVNYLAALDAAGRQAFLQRAEAITRSRLRLIHESPVDQSATDSWTLQATSRGLTLQLEARLKWLAELRKMLG